MWSEYVLKLQVGKEGNEEIGIILSGGVDTCAVMAALSKVLVQRILTCELFYFKSCFGPESRYHFC